MMHSRRSWIVGVSSLLLLLPLGACGTSAPEQGAAGEPATSTIPLTVGAIPDQDPELLQRLYSKLADYLEAELGVPVEYKPVTDYAAAVTAFRVGDLDLVWFGALTGVQARLQLPGAEAIAQRDIDEQFHSIFIATADSGIAEIQDISDLAQLKGRTFTFGSESSTSGRLMPQAYLEQAGVDIENDFRGEVGFSGNHDAILKLVEAGTYEVGVLNEQVWIDRLAAGAVDTDKVVQIWRTPPYYNYHWVIGPEVDQRYGEGFSDRVQAALMALDPAVPEHKEILDLFGAERFIVTTNENYADIEAVGRKIGKIQ
ncbi:MAG: putative selenate ABC transporter substrate-binding protein [Leptolyngbya sp.]|jgi:phosphonate transport system substrate-binding protein|uniref:Putative selenate ABC transporter substrate-binding protein n=1 Tax=Shackletoniella antarctica TaxID=268115 RepID=A0A2W4Y6M3_9CYAN|nr:MAG: putative selenate ABC transporter substrate-binding protein [Shackletoniella antarctica]PZV20143.1 MAG: putative selenate ABC transporter substrate-binding protein [Leptolyngbya sp.]